MTITLPAAETTVATPHLDPRHIRDDFPILASSVDANGRPLTFLDSAASSQKPEVVLAAMDDYYRTANANIHRGVYRLSEEATGRYERARQTVAAFIGAPRARECIFVRNTTEAINLVAMTWGRRNIGPDDLIVLTVMEHHANLVPWQVLAEERGARLAFVRMTWDGRLDLDHLDGLLAEGPKLVAFSQVSNALGTIHPAAEITRRAKAAGATVLIDAAQSVPHLPVDVAALGCDFLAFSGHKMLGPMGSGVLWGQSDLLESMPPFMTGGSMIRTVELTGTTWADVPAKFEAGTPAVADAVGLGVACDYLSAIGMDAVRAHERALVELAIDRLSAMPGVTLLGPLRPDVQAGVLSFTVDGVHPHDVAAILDEHNVAVRAGHHCCQPLMRELGVVATTRASFSVYNDESDIDRLVEALERVRVVFA